MLFLRSPPQFEKPWLPQGHLTRKHVCTVYALLSSEIFEKIWPWETKCIFGPQWVLNKLRLNLFFYYMLFIQATHNDSNLEWLACIKLTLRLELFSPVPRKRFPSLPPIHLVHFTRLLWRKKNKNQSYCFIWRGRNAVMSVRKRKNEGGEGVLQRRHMIDVPLIRWVGLADGSNMERVYKRFFAEFAAPQKRLFLNLL